MAMALPQGRASSMLEARSQLASHIKPGLYGAGDHPVVTLSEVRGRSIIQVAGWPDTFETVSTRLATAAGGAVPSAFGIASVADTVTAIWVGAERLWFTADDPALLKRFDGVATDEDAMLLDLSDSRTVLRLKGGAARSVLIKGIAVDLHTDAFPVQAIAHTMVEHVGVLLHRVGPEAFELFVPRSYSANIWYWLTESAEEFGYEVEG
jgi:heterotetrameric sarcosine oxidase gamma subunit